METVPIAVWLAHDPDVRRITGNRHASDILRVAAAGNQSLSAPEPGTPGALSRLQGQSRSSIRASCRFNAPHGGEIVRNEELRIVFDDGTYFDELASATPVRDAAGTVVGAVGAAVDITERKVAEERVRHARAARPAYRAPEPGAVPRPPRARTDPGTAQRRAARRSCCSTSTSSRRSTTALATPPAMRCCARSPLACVASRARAIPGRDWAATSSRWFRRECTRARRRRQMARRVLAVLEHRS